MNCDLPDMVALVTGGLGQVGTIVADVLAAAGARVAVSDRPEVVSDRGEAARGWLCLPHDVTSAESWRLVVEVVSDRLDSVDILVNLAGVMLAVAPIEDVTLDQWNQTLAVNATGVFLGCQAVLPAMRRRRRGKIINISSIAGKDSSAWSSAYGASKHAIIGLTQSVAKEVGKDNINVNAICPGPMRTKMIEPMLSHRYPGKSWADLESDYLAAFPLGRMIDPIDVGHLVVFLASEAARNIHGQSISLCGGQDMHT